MCHQAVLEIDDLHFSWADQYVPVFGPITLAFENGNITTVLGSNGSGKTTFLNVISQRLVPTKGHVYVEGKLAKQADFNYMLQDASRLLFPHLKMGENIALWTKEAVKRQKLVNELKNILFQDGRILDYHPHKCSGGQRQRAVLCRALAEVSAFPVTLLDEPFAQISQDVKPKIYRVLHDTVKDAHRTLIMVTHDVAEAVIVGDRTVVITPDGPRTWDVTNITNSVSYLAYSELRNDIQRTLFLSGTAQMNNEKLSQSS